MSGLVMLRDETAIDDGTSVVQYKDMSGDTTTTLPSTDFRGKFLVVKNADTQFSVTLNPGGWVLYPGDSWFGYCDNESTVWRVISTLPTRSHTSIGPFIRKMDASANQVIMNLGSDVSADLRWTAPRAGHVTAISSWSETATSNEDAQFELLINDSTTAATGFLRFTNSTGVGE